MALAPQPGRIFSFKGTFGFLEYDLESPKPPRLYFHAGDVEGNVQLRPGDEVTFTVANRPPRAEVADKERGASPQGALIARRVIRTKVSHHPASRVLCCCSSHYYYCYTLIPALEG